MPSVPPPSSYRANYSCDNPTVTMDGTEMTVNSNGSVITMNSGGMTINSNGSVVTMNNPTMVSGLYINGNKIGTGNTSNVFVTVSADGLRSVRSVRSVQSVTRSESGVNNKSNAGINVVETHNAKNARHRGQPIQRQQTPYYTRTQEESNDLPPPYDSVNKTYSKQTEGCCTLL